MARKGRREPLTIAGLATRIGTVLAVSVYTDAWGTNYRQWRCWFDDQTLRYIPAGSIYRGKLRAGCGTTLEEAMKDFADDLRGATIFREGRELTDEGQEWRVPGNLRA